MSDFQQCAPPAFVPFHPETSPLLPSHGENTSSILVGVTSNQVSVIDRYSFPGDQGKWRFFAITGRAFRTAADHR